MSLKQELSTVDRFDFFMADSHLSKIKQAAPEEATPGLDAIMDIMAMIRDRFYSPTGGVKVPPAINVIAWIKIVIFVVKRVIRIVRHFKGKEL
jgi:hypothetical protein